MEERLHVGLLVRRPTTGHALLDAAPRQALAKRDPQKLAAAIAVKDQAPLRTATPQRGIHDGAREGGVSRRGQPPGQHTARVLIQDRRQVPPPTRNRKIGEVADPDLVEAARLRPLHTVGILAEPPMGPRRTAIHAHDPCAAAAHAHQPLDPSMTEMVAPRRQRPMDARTAVRAATVLEDRTDVFEEGPVLPLVRTRRPVAPRVESRACDCKEPTEPRYAEGVAFVVDEREDRGFRAEVNRMSCFRSACSSWSNACARCST